MVARYGLKTADLTTALNTFAAILKRNPSDIEALNVIGRYAYSRERFREIRGRVAAAFCRPGGGDHP